MSYEIIPFESNKIPEHIRNAKQSELTKRLKKGSSLKRISIRNGVFRCVVGGEEVAKNKNGYMDVVIVNVAENINRTYYSNAYDPNAESASPPNCSSANGIVPDSHIESPIAKTCAECPMNIKGSGSNATTKACRYFRRIAVALATDLDSGVYQLVLPSKSVFGKGDATHMPFNQYLQYVISQNFSIENLITRMSIDDDADQPTLVFQAIGYPNQSMIAKIEELSASQEAIMAIELPVIQTDEGKNPGFKKLESPNKEVKVDEEEEVPPPTVKPKTSVQKTESPKPDLTSILSKFSKKSITQSNDTEVDDE